MTPAAATSYTTDVSQLYGERLRLANPDDHVVLPEIISKEPLGPAVRHGDDQWFDIVKWMLFAMVDAEELGITQKNVDDMVKSDNPEIRRLLGTEGNFGEQLGLTKDWVVRIVKGVGNYGEVVRAQCRPGLEARIARGLEQAVDQGRLAIRAADPLTQRGSRGDELPKPRPPPGAFLADLRRTAGSDAQDGADCCCSSCSSRCWSGSATKSPPMPRTNLQTQHIASGFGFLSNTAGFGISQALIPYSRRPIATPARSWSGCSIRFWSSR